MDLVTNSNARLRNMMRADVFRYISNSRQAKFGHSITAIMDDFVVVAGKPFTKNPPFKALTA